MSAYIPEVDLKEAWCLNMISWSETQQGIIHYSWINYAYAQWKLFKFHFKLILCCCWVWIVRIRAWNKSSSCACRMFREKSCVAEQEEPSVAFVISTFLRLLASPWICLLRCKNCRGIAQIPLTGSTYRLIIAQVDSRYCSHMTAINRAHSPFCQSYLPFRSNISSSKLL